MHETSYEFVGGALCLDFANTVHDYDGADPRDELHGPDDLIAWGRQAGIPGLQRARRTAGALREARRLRGLVYRLFSSLASGSLPADADLKDFSRGMARAARRRKLIARGKEIQWVWDPRAAAHDRILWMVLDSTAQLLTSPVHSRIRLCEGVRCTWLFLDHSKNRTRRWCDMKVCGNREKSRRHYDKVRTRRKTA